MVLDFVLIAFLFLLSGLWGLNGVWLMAPVSAVASGILTLALARTLKIEKNTAFMNLENL